MLNYAIFQGFLVDEAGVTAIEYALIGSLIAVVIAATVTTVGLNLNDLYEMVAGKVQDAIGGS